MHNNRETVIIPQTIIVPTKSIIVASLAVTAVVSRKINRGTFIDDNSDSM